MDEILKSGLITEILGHQNVEYLLNDNKVFLQTGYKVLKSQEKSGFIKCAKLLYNGKIKLIFFTSEFKSLKNIITALDGDMLLIVLSNLLNAVIQIKNNGFLSCNNLDIGMDKIFVNTKTLEVNLIYLPVSINTLGDISMFEYELRTRLIKIVSSTRKLSEEKTSRVCGHLANGSISLEQLYMLMVEEQKNENSIGHMLKIDSQRGYTGTSGNIRQPPMILKTTDMDLEFYINKPQFVLGKNIANVDGIIPYNKAISRIHCKIIFQNGSYFVMDMRSANGTYVNNQKLKPSELHPLKNGDQLRLANSMFLVNI